MPLLILSRLFASLLSLAILGGAAYLAWTWYDGVAYYRADGLVERVREDWRLWVAIGLLAISAVGRVVLVPLLGRPDTPETRLSSVHGQGQMIDTPTGARLYVEELGDRSKPTLLFTHGWGLDSTIWTYAKRDLVRDFHVVVWDLPGLGKSRAGIDKRFDPKRFSEELGAVIQFIAPKKLVLVGHSIGGMAIQTLVRDEPERVAREVSGIVLLNTTFTDPIRTVFASSIIKVLRWPVLEPTLFLTWILQPLAWLDAWRAYLSGAAHVANRIQFGRSVTRGQLNAVTLLGTRNPQGVLARGNLGMFRWDATGAMSSYPGPVLVIGGAMDLATKLEASRVIASDARNARLIEVDGVNHNGFLENAPVYNGAIRDFALALGEPQTTPFRAIMAKSQG